MIETQITVDNNEGKVMAFEDEVQTGQLDFVFKGDVLVIEHTRTFEGYQGKGVAGALVLAVSDYAVNHELKVQAVCSYAAAWYKRHPQYEDIIS